MLSSHVDVLTQPHPEGPEADMTSSLALLRDVAAGRCGPTARVFRPPSTLAFGKLDAFQPGYAAAQAAARAHGFVPVLRLGGGRAAAYHRGCVVLELLTPEVQVVRGTERRFARAAQLVAGTLRELDVPAQVGELPGEYCPGRHSVHAGGVKLAGIAQRSVRGASLVTGFVAVEGGAALRAVLEDVYAALELAWDPCTAGAAQDVTPGVQVEELAAALVRRLGSMVG